MVTLLASAILGGLILNAMPCVLPVLSLKAFQLLDQRKHDDARRRLHGLAYTAGTVGFFLAAAAFVIVLKTSGTRLGWGLQFQHAPFVATLTAIIFAFALNALGVFDLSVSSRSVNGDQDALSTSLFNGFFAAVMATPCTAPFLSTAAGVALAAETSSAMTVAIFGCIGFGLALPYLVFTFVPALTRVLPRPGNWMQTFKMVMGFTLLATAVWFFGVLQAQVTVEQSNGFLFFLVGLGAALWAVQQFGGLNASGPARLFARVAGMAFVTGLALLLVRFDKPVKVDDRIAWVAFDKQQLSRTKTPVFIDFTAEWCASCKANEKAFLETDAVRTALARTKIVPMKADLTNENEELFKQLETWGRNGIPAYVIAYPDSTTELLPVVITTDIVVAALESAHKKWQSTRNP